MASITRRRTADPDRRATVEAILSAAERLLTNGANFTALGVQQISAEAGVARSTFYSHFRDKIDLLTRLAGTMRDSSFAVVSVWHPVSDGVEGLADSFLRVIRTHREHRAVLQAVVEVAAYDATIRTFWNEGLIRFTNRTIERLRDEQDSGRTPRNIDVESVTRVIIQGGEQAIVEHVTAGDPADDATFARELALIWWHGVYRRPPS